MYCISFIHSHSNGTSVIFLEYHHSYKFIETCPDCSQDGAMFAAPLSTLCFIPFTLFLHCPLDLVTSSFTSESPPQILPWHIMSFFQGNPSLHLKFTAGCCHLLREGFPTLIPRVRDLLFCASRNPWTSFFSMHFSHLEQRWFYFQSLVSIGCSIHFYWVSEWMNNEVEKFLKSRMR